MDFNCPSCSKPLPEAALAPSSSCPSCGDEFDFVAFPAAHAAPAVPHARAAMPEDSTCFFHSTNQAEFVCDGCGRFLCAVCAVPFAGRRLCSPCIAKERKEKAELVSNRTRFEIVSCYFAFFAFLTAAIWPVSICLSAAGYGFLVVGIRKPKSVTGTSRAWFIAAGIANTATLAIAIATMYAFMFLRARHHT